MRSSSVLLMLAGFCSALAATTTTTSHSVTSTKTSSSKSTSHTTTTAKPSMTTSKSSTSTKTQCSTKVTANFDKEATQTTVPASYPRSGFSFSSSWEVIDPTGFENSFGDYGPLGLNATSRPHVIISKNNGGSIAFSSNQWSGEATLNSFSFACSRVFPETGMNLDSDCSVLVTAKQEIGFANYDMITNAGPYTPSYPNNCLNEEGGCKLTTISGLSMNGGEFNFLVISGLSDVNIVLDSLVFTLNVLDCGN